MKVPLSWLKEFVDVTATPAQIAQLLTQAGIEVDAIDRTQAHFSKVVIGKVLATEPHPNADKLVVAQVTDGSETFQVVCGAPNCRAGIKTAFALIGAEIKDANEIFKIKKSKIRGVESYGMLCSGKELGISNDADGILEFNETMNLGIDLAELYSDFVFEISLTPNLGHVNSVVGIARELSASLKKKFKRPLQPELLENGAAITTKVSVVVEDSKKCPRYAARLVEGVKVGPSPEWLKKKIESSGLRSINNIVDVTNWVLLESGHPMHAFDFEKVSNGKIVVRTARNGEKLLTLDGKERELDESMLVIADSEKSLAIAGVMGGQGSEVSENTTSILLEAAYFEPATVRKTSKKLQLTSDSSKRFEKGVDPNQVLDALAIAARVIQQIAGGEIAAGVIDIAASSFPELEVDCRLSRINKILGTHLSVDEVEKILLNLGFKCQFDGQDTFKVSVPTYRVDVTSEIDLVEEVARLWGYDNISREPAKYQSTKLPHAPAYLFEREVKRKLIAEGLQEFVNCDLIGPSLFKNAYGTTDTPVDAIEVLNPVSVEQSVLRTSLLPGLLQVVKHNFDRECKDLAGFEVGRIHFKENEKFDGKFKEQTVLAIILSGKSSPNPYAPKPQAYDFRDLKGIVENLLKGLGIDNYSIRVSSLPILHPGKQASIFVGGLEIGSFGEIHPSVQRRIDLPQTLLFAELNLLDLFKVRKRDITMKSLPIFPSSERDWTVTLLEKASVQQVIDSIKSFPSALLEEVSLTDIYRSPALEGKKNATFHFVYRDTQKTIEQEAVDQEHTRLINSALQLISGCLPPT